METWSYTESQKSLRLSARTVISLWRDDLHAIYTQNDIRGEIKMVLDYDAYGRQRLRFVRKLKEEKTNSSLRNAGNAPVSEGHQNYYYFAKGETQKLRASGGLAEVVYLIMPQKNKMELWRGVRTPIGGSSSFFQGQNIQQAQQIQDTCHLVSDEVLYFGIKCWTPQTIKWDVSDKGPSLLWDSSRKQLKDFLFYQKNATEDIFPTKLQLHLILKKDHTPRAFLATEIDAKQASIPLRFVANLPILPEVHGNLVRMEDEWISYTQYQDDQLIGVTRGMLGTTPQSHPADSFVYWGVSFKVNIFLATYH
jgi:hypothetical protein